MVQNNILRDERQRRGWTYKDVADKINLPDSRTVGRWERGMTSPGPHYRQELSRIFEKSIEELGLLKAPAARDTPPIKASSNTFNKLPAAFSSFVGRMQEVITVSTFLKDPRCASAYPVRNRWHREDPPWHRGCDPGT